jgi:ribulose-5-phosphate 4-epimerase/fuculose-1-phosphate aldolase
MNVIQNEDQIRSELAACYRLFDWLGWTELIFNHITVRLPNETQPTYLINPFGLHYSEVSAENLIAINTNGQRRDDSTGLVNQAGFVIHSAIHEARDDAHCVMHIHTTAGCAISCKESGLRNDNFYSAMLFDNVSYHDYEGVTTGISEQPRLVASLGKKNHMILRNHGLLAVGTDIPSTFMRLWVMQRACEIQLASDAGVGPNRQIPVDILRKIPETRVVTDAKGARLVFNAMLRRAGLFEASIHKFS